MTSLDQMIVEEKIELWNRAMAGDSKSLVQASFLRGLIGAEDLAEFDRIEKFCRNCGD